MNYGTLFERIGFGNGLKSLIDTEIAWKQGTQSFLFRKIIVKIRPKCVRILLRISFIAMRKEKKRKEKENRNNERTRSPIFIQNNKYLSGSKSHSFSLATE